MFTLNSDQQAAVDGILAFISSPGKVISQTLTGAAGTGKTSCMREIAVRAGDARFLFTAPTNKATRVLEQAVGADCCTIYSALGLQLMPNGMVRELKQRSKHLPIDDIDVCFVDESSMINTNLNTIIEESAKKHKVSFVFLGDRFQLPPVGEDFSPIWERPIDYELTKVMRFDNQILNFATRMREIIAHPYQSLSPVSDNADGEGIWVVSARDMMREVCKQAPSGDFQSGELKCIAWRNIIVDEMNQMIRAALGTQDLTLPWSTGDRIIAKSPCIGEDKAPLLHTDDECEVLKVEIATHPIFPEYECFITEVRCENRTVSVWTPTPNSIPYINRRLKQLSDEATTNGRVWKDFWALKESFHEIGLAYAITAHRSQGSTYRTAFVHFQDILSNRNRVEALKCLYVAASRPQKVLYLGK